MRLVYEGPHDAVEVPAAGVVAERGVPVEIDDKLTVEVGETTSADGQPAPVTISVVDSLLEQDVWHKAGAKGAKDSDSGGDG